MKLVNTQRAPASNPVEASSKARGAGLQKCSTRDEAALQAFPAKIATL